MPLIFNHPAPIARDRRLWRIAGHFFSGVGAGTWLFAVAFGAAAALSLGIVAVGLGGLGHLLVLGRPARFGRMVRARTWWIGRGFLGMLLFTAGAIPYRLRPLARGSGWAAEGSGRRPRPAGGVRLWGRPSPWDLVAVIDLWIAVSANVMVAFHLEGMRNTGGGGPPVAGRGDEGQGGLALPGGVGQGRDLRAGAAGGPPVGAVAPRDRPWMMGWGEGAAGRPPEEGDGRGQGR